MNIVDIAGFEDNLASNNEALHINKDLSDFNAFLLRLKFSWSNYCERGLTKVCSDNLINGAQILVITCISNDIKDKKGK